VGVEKPIFAPREPNSLAQLGISPLTGSGNLWRRQPQVVFEQRVNFTRATQLRARVGVLQSGEDFPGNVMPPGTRIAPRRPGLEGRFEIAHAIDDQRRVEVAPGFHVSTSHLGGLSVPSDLFSLDWFATPVNRVQFTGAFFRGRNVAHFGATRQAFVFHADGRITPVHSTGGWAQLSLIATDRLSFNLMGGQQDDRNSDLNRLGIAKNMTGAANVMYRLAPNVVVSLEALQLRTTYLGLGTRKNNRYDLAVAYMF
jgi:hypothetical protein